MSICRKLIPALTLSVMFSSSVWASICDVAPGESISVNSPESLVKQLSAIQLTKDDFETTSQFEERRQAEIEKIGIAPNELIFVQGQLDKKRLTYNADRQRFEIKPYAWDNGIGRVYVEQFRDYYTKKNHPIIIDEMFNISSPLSETSKRAGSYTGSNALGVEATIVRMNVFSIIAYQGNHGEGLDFEQYRSDGITVERGKVIDMEWPVNYLEMPPTEARDFRENSRVAYGLVLKPPYYVQATHATKPTIQNRVESNYDLNVIVADIKCVVLQDGNGKIAKIIATNK